MKKRRFDSGGITEGSNSGIDDDTRARAMKWLADRQSGAYDDEADAAIKKATSKPTSKPKVTDTGDETARLAKRVPAPDRTPRKGTVEDIPKDSAGPVRGERINNDSTFMRNAKNTASALTPLGSGPVSKVANYMVDLGRSAKAGFAYGRAQRAAEEAAKAVRAEPRIPRSAESRASSEMVAEGGGNQTARAAAQRQASINAEKAARKERPGRAAKSDEESRFADEGNPNFKRGGKIQGYAKGGVTRGDGIAQRGKTRGKYL